MAGGTSYNGWPCSDDPNAINVQPFGDAHGVPFPAGVRGGDVAKVLGYVCTQLHYRVEACVSGWDWGYEYRENVNSPGSMSCHASATAVDYNAPNHPNSASGTFTSAQRGEIYAILDEVQGAVQWGGDYSGTKDEMHFEIIVDADTLSRVAATLPGTAEPDDLPFSEDELKQAFKQSLDEWYRDSVVVELNNGETTTPRQFIKNLDQRTFTSEQYAVNHP